MKKLLASILLGFIFFGFANAQTLPAKIRTYLNQNYKGWKMSGFDRACPSETKKYVVAGDFNGDKKRDYAVKFIKGRNGYIIAFIAQGTGFKPRVLESTDALDIKSTVLGLIRKGEQYPPDGIEGDNPRLVRAKNDFIYKVPCESDAVGYYIFKNGRFN